MQNIASQSTKLRITFKMLEGIEQYNLFVWHGLKDRLYKVNEKRPKRQSLDQLSRSTAKSTTYQAVRVKKLL